MPETSVQKTEYEIETEDGETRKVEQYRATIPKDLAEFFDLEQGDTLSWGAGSASDKMEVQVIKDD